jgi:hypothetical protein
VIAAHAPSEAGGIDWRRLATDRNVSPVVARGLWERARAAAHDDLAEAEHAYLRMLEEAETADATHEPGRETLVGSTPGARDAASLGPGKWTRVLLEDQKAGGPGAPAKRKPEGAAHPQGAAQPQPGAEPVKHASPEELRDQLVGVAQAGKNAAALLAAADPATIIEALRELRDTAGPGVLQTLMSVAGGAIERILGHRLPDPQAHTGPIGERVQFAVDDETHTQYVDDDGVPMMASTPKPVKAKVDEWRTAAATQPPQMQQRVAPELARASSLATTATDQARKAKAGDPAAKAALPATQRALGSSLASVSRQIGAEPAKKPAPLPATAPAAPAPVASTAGHPTPGPAPASPTAAVPGSAAATKATGPKAPEPTAPRPPPDPAAIKAADELLHNVFHTCGAKLPHDLGALAPQGRIDQSSKPAADLRRQYYPSFDSLKPAMSSVAAEKATQLDHEVGLESGAEGLPVKFKGDVLAAFHADTYNTAASFEALFNEVARRGYMMKGKPLLAEDFNAAVPADHSLARVINTDSAFSRYLDKAEAERAWGKDHPGAAPTTDELTAYILQKAKADASGTIKKFVLPTLVEFPSWLFPEPDIKHDAVFSQYCDLLALYANWYPKGHLRMVVKRTAVTDKVAKGGLRKPTVFDGTLSPLWLQRDNRDRNWGKTGGGLREALMKIEWADIDHAKWVLVEIDPKYQAVLDAQAATKAKQATPADAKLIAEHEKSMVVQTEKAQEAEHVHSRPDEKDPAKPIIVSTTMAGAAHTLKADPAIGKVELHSVPGGAVEKLQSVVDLVGPEARGKATNALAKATAAAGIVTEPTLKSGAKTADRPHAVQRLDDKIKELAIAVRSFGDAAKLTDAHPDVVHRVRAEEELRKQRIAQARLTPPTQAQAPGGTAPNPAIKQPPPPVASAPTPATPKLVAGGDASAHHEATEPSAGTHAPAPTSPAPAPATATTPAATTTAAPAAAATAAAPAAPTIEGFNAAVAVNNRAEADRIWGLLPDAQKLSLDFPAAIQAISHFGTRGLSYIIEGSLGMGDPALPAAILAKMDSDPAGWWKALDARNQWDGFLGVAPKRAHSARQSMLVRRTSTACFRRSIRICTTPGCRHHRASTASPGPTTR